MPLPPMINGARFQPELIWKWVIIDASKPHTFFCGYWKNLDVQMSTWSSVPRLRWEFEEHEEAIIEAAMLIEMGLADNRRVEVCRVGHF